MNIYNANTALALAVAELAEEERRERNKAAANIISSITCSALGLVFIVLKLVGVINWSWWWVLCPFWGGFALAFAYLIVYLTVVFTIEICKKRKADRKKLKEAQHE